MITQLAGKLIPSHLRAEVQFRKILSQIARGSSPRAVIPVFMSFSAEQFARIPRCGEFVRDPASDVFGTVVAASYDLKGGVLGLHLLQWDNSRVHCVPFFHVQPVEKSHPEYRRAEQAGILGGV